MNHFHAREKQTMASKLNIMTFFQQVQGLTEVAERCPQPPPAPRLVLPARFSSASRRRRLMISIEAQNLQDNPASVSITHVKATTLPPALSR
jgi:hypothetical protein